MAKNDTIPQQNTWSGRGILVNGVWRLDRGLDRKRQRHLGERCPLRQGVQIVFVVHVGRQTVVLPALENENESVLKEGAGKGVDAVHRRSYVSECWWYLKEGSDVFGAELVQNAPQRPHVIGRVRQEGFDAVDPRPAHHNRVVGHRQRLCGGAPRDGGEVW